MDILRHIESLASRISALERAAYRGAVRTADAESDVSAILNPGAWTAPTLLNSATNVGGAYAPAGYYQDELGRVFTRGRVDLPDGWTSAVVFNYGVGFRPVFTHDFNLVVGSFEGANVWATGEVQTDGDLVIHVGGGTIEQVPLDVIQFRTS